MRVMITNRSSKNLLPNIYINILLGQRRFFVFNVAVISIKDIGKYIAKALCIIIVLIIVVSLFNENKKIEKSIETTGKQLINYSFLGCLDICIPGLKQIEFERQKTSTIEKILGVELSMSSHIKIPEDLVVNEEELTQEDIDELEIPENITTEVIETNVKERYTNSYRSVKIKNETDFGLTEEMLTPNAEISNPNKVLIYHTHTCESYTPSEAFWYEMTGNYRTTDLNFTVSRVGTELKKCLEQNGYTVIHDTTYHDYPAYSGSYDRSYATVENILQNNLDTEIIFDIHRDAIGDSSYAPTVKIGEEYAAQLMFVIGTNGGGLEHPNWLENLKVAIKIQEKANEKYPGLFKPIILRNSRYNQNLGKGASIIEVGATGNTLEQCNNSMKFLADVLKDVFK